MVNSTRGCWECFRDRFLPFDCSEINMGFAEFRANQHFNLFHANTGYVLPVAAIRGASEVVKMKNTS
jgi:hypothetical protein